MFSNTKPPPKKINLPSKKKRANKGNEYTEVYEKRIINREENKPHQQQKSRSSDGEKGRSKVGIADPVTGVSSGLVDREEL